MSISYDDKSEIIIESCDTVVEAPSDVPVTAGDPSHSVTSRKKEYSIVGDALYFSVEEGAVPPWLEDVFDNLVNNSLDNSFRSLDNIHDSLRSAIDSIELAKNDYTSAISIYDSVEGVVISKLEGMNATVGAAQANIKTLETVMATETSAMAARMDQLSAELGDAQGAVTNLQGVVVNGLADGIHSNSAELDNKYAELQSVIAFEISTVEASLGDINGEIERIDTVVINGLIPDIITNITDINEEIGRIDGDISNSNENIGTLTNNLSDTIIRIDNIDTAIADETLRVDGELTDVKQSIVDAEGNITEAFSDLADTRQDLTDLRQTAYQRIDEVNDLLALEATALGGRVDTAEGHIKRINTTAINVLSGDLHDVDGNKVGLGNASFNSEGELVNSSGDIIELDIGILEIRGALIDTDGKEIDLSEASYNNEGRVVDKHNNIIDLTGATIVLDPGIEDINGNLINLRGHVINADGNIVSPDGEIITLKGGLASLGNHVSDKYGNVVDLTGSEMGSDGVLRNPDGDVIEYKGLRVETQRVLDLQLTELGATLFDNETGAFSQLENMVLATDHKLAASFAYDAALVLPDGQVYKSGFGLHTSAVISGEGTESDPYKSEFWVDADTFRVRGRGSDNGTYDPFVVDSVSGKTVISNALIHDADITNIVSNGVIESADSVNIDGQSRKKLQLDFTTGTLSMAAGGSGGYLTIEGNSIVVYDNNGTKRVRMGIW